MPENKNQNQGRDLMTNDREDSDYKGTGGTGQVANQWDKESGGGQTQQTGNTQGTQRGGTGTSGGGTGSQKGGQQGNTQKDVGNKRDRQGQDEQRDNEDMDRGTDQREEDDEEEVV